MFGPMASDYTSSEIKTRLGFEVDESGARKYDQLISRARAERDVKTELKADVDRRGFDQYSALIRRARGDTASIGSDLTGLGKIVSLIKFPAAITAIGGLAQAFSAASAGAVALTSALAPLTGALAAYPALLSSVGQAMGVVKLATSGLSEALGGNEEALKRLTPEGRGFVEYLKDLQPRVRALQRTAQAGLFPGIQDGIRVAMRNFGPLRSVIDLTARSLGNLSRLVGQTLGSPAWGRDIQTIGAQNASTIEGMGEATVNLANALRHVLVVSGPFVSWLGGLVTGWTAAAEGAAKAGRATGDLAAFFGETREVMTDVLSLSGALATAFLNIGKTGYGLGRGILHDLNESAESFARWTGSAKGQNVLESYFKRAKAPLYEFGRLVGDVTKMFFRLGTGQGATQLFRSIRVELLPVLEEVIQTTTKAFGPALIEALTNITLLFGELAGTSGPLTTFVKVIGDIAGGLARILDQNPGLKTALITLIGFNAALKGIKVASALLGITSLIRGVVTLTGAYRDMRTAGLGAAAANLAFGRSGAAGAAGTVGGGIAGGIGKGGAGKLGAGAMAGRLGTAGLVVGVAAAGVWAGMKLGDFLFNGKELFGVKLKDVKGWFKDAFAFAGDFAKKAVKSVKGFFGDAWDWVADKARKGLLGPLPWFVAKVGDIVPKVIRVFADVFGKVSGTVRRVIGNIANTIVDKLTAAVGAIGRAFKRVFNKIKQIASDVFNWIKDKAGSVGATVDDVTGFIDPIGGGGPNIGDLFKADGGWVGPGYGGPRFYVAGEGRKAEVVLSEEGDRTKNIGYALEWLRRVGVPVAAFAKGGVAGQYSQVQQYEAARSRINDRYSLDERRYSLDGETSAAELEALRQLRAQEGQIIGKELAVLASLVPSLTQEISKAQKQFTALKKKPKTQAKRQALQNQIQVWKDQLSESKSLRYELSLGKDGNSLDQQELVNAINEAKQQSLLTTPQDRILSLLALEESEAALTATTADDEAVRAKQLTQFQAKKALLQQRLKQAEFLGDGLLADQLREALIDTNSQIGGLTGAGSASAAPSLSEQERTFVDLRHDLFSKKLAPIGTKITNPGASDFGRSSGGGNGSGTHIENVNFEVTTTAPIEDPHLPIKQGEADLRGFLS